MLALAMGWASPAVTKVPVTIPDALIVAVTRMPDDHIARDDVRAPRQRPGRVLFDLAAHLGGGERVSRK